MIVFSVLLFTVSALMIVAGAFICSGKYEALFDFYLGGATDIKAYSKAYGIAMMCMSIPCIACGVLQLLTPEIPFVIIAIAILVVGFAVGYVFFNRIQKKYNGGMF